MITLPSPVELAGLVPAFRDLRTGETHLASTTNGEPSAVHEFAHLPAHWIVERDSGGAPVALHPAVVAGYRRGDSFLALDAVLRPVADA